MTFKGVPGRSLASGLMMNLPRVFFGMTPESLNNPQYSLVREVGSTLSDPTTRHPYLLSLFILGLIDGLNSSGGMYLITWLSMTCSRVVSILWPFFSQSGYCPIFRPRTPVLRKAGSQACFSNCSLFIKEVDWKVCTPLITAGAPNFSCTTSVMNVWFSGVM